MGTLVRFLGAVFAEGPLVTEPLGKGVGFFDPPNAQIPREKSRWNLFERQDRFS